MSEPLLSVDEARRRVLAGAQGPRPQEMVAVAEAFGRTLAQDLAAMRTQPPTDVSAMDGYAVRAADIASLPARLKRIGESAAGHGFAGEVGAGETVRIFTGAPVPQGADSILIQENARVDGDIVEALQSVAQGYSVRGAGIDFTEAATLLAAGTRLSPADIALAAAMNHARLPVYRKPRVAILATGDELVQPGEAIGRDQIVASNSYAIAAFVRLAGGEPLDLGIAGDTFAAIEAGIKAARDAGADVLVTLGGASVGDHDLVKTALAKEGMELGFWRIAMRPGKPLIHGRIPGPSGAMQILGLPGNPVSSVVCGLMFLMPLVRALSGDPQAGADRSEPARLGVALRANDKRQDFLRARLEPGEDGLPVATAFDLQDSSLLRVLAQAQCLIVRLPFAPAAIAGDPCRIIRLPGGSGL
jgi:molybdopterin molybdotransferase